MTQITTPPSPYKIITPKTVLSGGVQNIDIDLSALAAKHLQLRFGLATLVAITGGTQCNFTPRTVGFGDGNYHYTTYMGVGVPALAVIDNIGNSVLPINSIPGSDAVATDLAVFIVDMIDCQSTQIKTVQIKGTFMPSDAIKRTTWDIYAQFSNAAVFNGFKMDNLGGNFSTNSWYEVIQLD